VSDLGPGVPGEPGYFFTDPEARTDPQDPPRFVSVDDILGLHPAGPGLTLRPVFGRNLTMSFVSMEPHTEAPVHQHAEEQIGTIIEGSYEFDLDGEKRVVRKGDVYVVPPWVPHGAVTHDEPVLALDVFSPPRAGFRELMEQALEERDAAADTKDERAQPS
jgi:quercetin dioxygenase-like cupin family protein